MTEMKTIGDMINDKDVKFETVLDAAEALQPELSGNGSKYFLKSNLPGRMLSVKRAERWLGVLPYRRQVYSLSVPATANETVYDDQDPFVQELTARVNNYDS